MAIDEDVISEKETGVETITDYSINDKIKENLESIGIDYEKLSDKIKGYLYDIETIINPKVGEKDKALRILKEIPFNISSIAKKLNVSRTTLYNNNTLKNYIEHSVELFAKDNPYATCEGLKVSKVELEKQIEGFLDRDIEAEILKQEISALNKKLVEKEKEVQNLRERKREVDAEKRALEDKNKQIRRVIADATDLEQLRKTLADKTDKNESIDSKVIALNKE
jgi:DNA repair exonuclease SbcCD ATPase subunit